MANNKKGDYGQNDRNPQQKNQTYESQMNKDNNQVKNTKDANANTQRSSENGRESNVPDATSGSDKVNQVDIEIGRRLENQDAENTNTVPNPGKRISNPEDVNDENIRDAINTANNRVSKDSSGKSGKDFNNKDRNAGFGRSGDDNEED